MTFFLINFTALLSNAYPTDIAIITLKSKWAAKICGPLKWATPRKKAEKHWIRGSSNPEMSYFITAAKYRYIYFHLA